jgi:hypothetical protein
VDIKGKLPVQNTVEEIETYQKNWKEHIKKLQKKKRLPKSAFKYKPVRNRSTRCPKNRLKDQFLKEGFRIQA